MKRASVDRLEGDKAVLVIDGEERVVPRSSLPMDVREGDLLFADTLQRDEEGTVRLREEVRSARGALKRERNPGAL